ncbi:MFS transporter [Delftia tsuruhatensis]|uniref:MFS transporter n=1 Tax=Delftia tsuruhatensis TaxID=180282 RepID=UPI001F2B88C8|nr:MFS transporter [Delftia tsuruhatensis]
MSAAPEPSPHNNADPLTPSASPAAAPPRSQLLWAMLLSLLSAFALSQAFRTITSVMATGLQQDFGLTAQSLGAFAGLFGLSFGVAQLLMGIGMDLYGLRRTVLLSFPLAIAGSVLSATAAGYGWLMVGQLLIGVGCSPAFLACTMFISRHFPIERFAFLSGVGMGVGGLGLLFTGTPLAWLVQHFGWRSGFALLAVMAAASWLLIWWRVHEPAHAGTKPAVRESWGVAVRRMAQLFTLPHTLGIMILAMACYASFLSLRGLWLGPLLIHRYDFSLVESGNVALIVSLISLFSPAFFGRMDPGAARRRRWINNYSLLMGSLFLVMAFLHHAWANVALIFAMGLLSGYSVLQYADVRSSYPPELTGRALSLFTMAMFLGVALVQWFTGWVAAWAEAWGVEPYQAVMVSIAATLVGASTAFRFLPSSPLLRQASAV